MNAFSRNTSLRSVLMAGAVGAILLSGCSDPDSRAAKYEKHGEELVAQGQLDKAKLEFRNALKIKPTMAEPYYQLGLIDEGAGDLRNAFENYTRAEQQDPKHHGALIKLAGFYFGAGRNDDAQTRVDTVLKNWPDDATAHALNAAIMLRKGDNDGAAKEVEVALKLDPTSIPAISVKVGVYSAQNDVKKAAAALDDGIQRNPNNVSLMVLKVEFYKKHALPEQVAAAYQDIFKAYPAERSYRGEAATYFADQGQLDRAEQILRDGVAAAPTDLDMKRMLVSFLNLKRGMEPAEQELQKLIKAEPDNNNYLFWLTDLYVQHKAVDQAVALLNQIIVKNSSDDSSMAARTALARITFSRGDRDMADKLLSVVLAKQSSNPEALFIRAAINFDEGNYQTTINDLRSLIRDNPKATDAMQLLAEALVRVGHIDLAAEQLAQLLDQQPDNHAAQARLGQLYHMSGDDKRADVLLKAVTKDAPDYSIGWESQARVALDLKDYTTADTAISKLEKMPDQVLTATYLRGIYLLGQSKPSDAIDKFASVITTNPAAPQSALALQALVDTYRQQGHLDTAAHFIESIKSDTVDMHTALANVYVELKKLEAAGTEYDRAIALSAGQVDPFIGRARLYLAAGQTSDAEAILKKAAVAAPNDIRAPLLLADIAMRDNRYQEAIKIYDEILTRNPDIDVASNNYAELIADYQYNDKAALVKARLMVDHFQGSDNTALLDTVAWVYYRLGQYDQAASLMQRVMAGATVTPQMHYHYGALLLKQGNKAKAAEELKKATVPDAAFPGIEDAKLLISQM